MTRLKSFCNSKNKVLRYKEVPLGSHNLTMYVRDLAGNTGASETVNFTIASETEPKSDSDPALFPKVPIAAVSLAVIALVAAGLLVYHKKHKHNSVKEA